MFRAGRAAVLLVGRDEVLGTLLRGADGGLDRAKGDGRGAVRVAVPARGAA